MVRGRQGCRYAGRGNQTREQQPLLTSDADPRGARLPGENPAFAVEAGLAALHWLAEGYGYEITSAEMYAACRYTLEAVAEAGNGEETERRVRAIAARGVRRAYQRDPDPAARTGSRDAVVTESEKHAARISIRHTA
jgi:hypothetical protein